MNDRSRALNTNQQFLSDPFPNHQAPQNSPLAYKLFRTVTDIIDATKELLNTARLLEIRSNTEYDATPDNCTPATIANFVFISGRFTKIPNRDGLSSGIVGQTENRYSILPQGKQYPNRILSGTCTTAEWRFSFSCRSNTLSLPSALITGSKLDSRRESGADAKERIMTVLSPGTERTELKIWTIELNPIRSSAIYRSVINTQQQPFSALLQRV